MNILTLSGRRSLWDLLKDPQVRTGMYVWLMIAGMCVLIANVRAGW